MNIIIILLGIRADFAGYNGYFSRLQCIVSALHAHIIVQIVLVSFFSVYFLNPSQSDDNRISVNNPLTPTI